MGDNPNQMQVGDEVEYARSLHQQQQQQQQ
jgi:hypothetical protein